MTTIDTSQTLNGAQSQASQQLAGNFDTFLRLLTTQLQNQDPMSPMDSNQFTQQLVAFSGVNEPAIFLIGMAAGAIALFLLGRLE